MRCERLRAESMGRNFPNANKLLLERLEAKLNIGKNGNYFLI